jgi:hypothetical protein
MLEPPAEAGQALRGRIFELIPGLVIGIAFPAAVGIAMTVQVNSLGTPLYEVLPFIHIYFWGGGWYVDKLIMTVNISS